MSVYQPTETLASQPRKLFDNLISLKELLAELNHEFKQNTVYHWVQQGIPNRKIRGRLWFDRDEARAWLERSQKLCRK